MKKITTLVAAFFLTVALNAQTPVIEWQKSYGTSGFDHECHITAANDGGYLITGTTNSPDTGTVEDILVVKINSTGAIQWQKILGGSNTDTGYSSIALADGGYIIAGATDSADGDVTVDNHGMNDLWIVKLDNSGTIVWQKTYGGSNIEFTYGDNIKATPDGGFIVVTNTESNDGDVTGHHGNQDFWVVKLDSNGEMEWQKALGGSAADFAVSITTTPDGGYITAGHTHSSDGDVTLNHGFTDAWVVKLDADGDIVWQRTYGGTGADAAYAVSPAPGGGYYVVGNNSESNPGGDVTGNHGSVDVWILKLEENGDIIWQKSLGGTLNDLGFSGAVTPHNTYVVAGVSSSSNGDVTFNHGSEDYWVAEVDEDGELLWQKSLGGSSNDWAFSILPTRGGYIISGETTSGDGDVSEFFGLYDFWVVKLTTEEIAGLKDAEQNKGLIYPNPVKDILNFNEQYQTIAIYGTDGKMVLQANNKANINVSGLQEGIYLLKMETADGKISTQKLIKSK